LHFSAKNIKNWRRTIRIIKTIELDDQFHLHFQIDQSLFSSSAPLLIPLSSKQSSLKINFTCIFRPANHFSPHLSSFVSHLTVALMSPTHD